MVFFRFLFVLIFDLVLQHVRSQFSGQGSKLRSLHQKNAPGKSSLTSFNLIRSIRQAFMEDTVSSYCCAVPRGSYSHFIVCNSESQRNYGSKKDKWRKISDHEDRIRVCQMGYLVCKQLFKSPWSHHTPSTTTYNEKDGEETLDI